MKKIIATGVALIAASIVTTMAFPQVVHGAPTSEEHSSEVSYGDLDLGTAAGVEALNARIRSAARTVCGWSAAQSLAELNHSRRCFNVAVRRANVQIADAIQRRASQRYAASSVPAAGK